MRGVPARQSVVAVHFGKAAVHFGRAADISTSSYNLTNSDILTGAVRCFCVRRLDRPLYKSAPFHSSQLLDLLSRDRDVLELETADILHDAWILDGSER